MNHVQIAYHIMYGVIVIYEDKYSWKIGGSGKDIQYTPIVWLARRIEYVQCTETHMTQDEMILLM